MADEEFPLYMESMVKFGSMLDLTGITYDRALPLEGEITTLGLQGELNIDKAIALVCEPEFKLEVTSTTDSSVGLVSEVLGNIELKPTLTKDLKFDLSGEVKTPLLSLTPSGDFVWTGESTVGSPSLISTVSIEAALSELSASVDSLGLSLERMMRSLYDAPPSGSIKILNQITADNATASLNGSTVPRGVTQILEVEIVGTRLDTYTVVFSVKPEPNYAPSIYKDSTGNPGGVRTVALGISSVNTPSGTKQRGVWQIILDPEDTNQFAQTTTLLYELELQHLGFAENYRIEAGSFLLEV